MSVIEKPPCIDLPKLEPIVVPLPFGGELRSIANIGAPPSDCALIHSLMLQITPLLASMACMFKALKVIADLKEVITDTPPFVNAGAVPTLLGDIGKLAPCFGFISDPCLIVRMVAAIILMVVKYISCALQAFDSVFQFKLGLSISSDVTGDNPVLLAALECAEKNAQTAMDNLQSSMDGVMPLMQLVNILLEIAGQEEIDLNALTASTPSAAELLESDPAAPVRAVRDALQQVYESLNAICPA